MQAEKRERKADSGCLRFGKEPDGFAISALGVGIRAERIRHAAQEQRAPVGQGAIGAAIGTVERRAGLVVFSQLKRRETRARSRFIAHLVARGGILEKTEGLLHALDGHLTNGGRRGRFALDSDSRRSLRAVA